MERREEQCHSFAFNCYNLLTPFLKELALLIAELFTWVNIRSSGTHERRSVKR